MRALLISSPESRNLSPFSGYAKNRPGVLKKLDPLTTSVPCHKPRGRGTARPFLSARRPGSISPATRAKHGRTVISYFNSRRTDAANSAAPPSSTPTGEPGTTASSTTTPQAARRSDRALNELTWPCPRLSSNLERCAIDIRSHGIPALCFSRRQFDTAWQQLASSKGVTLSEPTIERIMTLAELTKWLIES